MSDVSRADLTECQRGLVDQIIQSAMGKPFGEQAAIARGLADGDEAVVREAMSILRWDEQGGSSDALARPMEIPRDAVGQGGVPEHPTADVVEPPAERATPPAGSIERVGKSIGPYRLLSVLGEGGFGVVYVAERREPIVQRIALKIIKPGMDTKAVIARFEQERQALAVMDHPNVAKVFDAGATAEGRPYFVMELVQGEPITKYCDRHNLTIRQRLELFIPVCEAVQHAHMKGIIHRDIKPSNVLVMVKDGKPIPKVIDFGVAKAVSHTLTEQTIFTEQGQLIGTPEYMSPEQAEMGAVDIDTRSDVYSLGVMLYELLTGALPFDPRELRSKGYDEIRRIIREVDPLKPSTKLTSLPLGPGSAGARDEESTPAAIAKHRQTHIDQLVRELRRELDWIPLKAMRKDRTERYLTAMDLADDIRYYLIGEPLVAGPEALLYRLRKYVRRRRGPAIAVTAVLCSLLAGLIGVSLTLAEANRQRVLAVALQAEAEERAMKLEEALRAVQTARVEAEHHETVAHAAISLLDGLPFGTDLVDREAQLAVSRRVIGHLAVDFRELLKERHSENRAGIYLGSLTNHTAIPPNDLAIFQRLMFTSMFNHVELRNHIDLYEDPNVMRERRRRLGYAESDTALFDQTHVYVLSCEFHLLERENVQLLDINTTITHLESGSVAASHLHTILIPRSDDGSNS